MCAAHAANARPSGCKRSGKRRYQLARIQLPDFKDTCHFENVRARALCIGFSQRFCHEPIWGHRLGVEHKSVWSAVGDGLWLTGDVRLPTDLL